MSKSLEVRVNTWVEQKLIEADLNYHVENDIPKQLSEALEGASKSGKGGTGRPDFAVSLHGRNIAVVIENKWDLSKLQIMQRDKIATTVKAVKEGAVNGALHYARAIIDSGKYDEVIAIGVAGGADEMGPHIQGKVFYVFDSDSEPKEVISNLENFNFLTDEMFDLFYDDCTLTDDEKHDIMMNTYRGLKKTAKELNALMNARAIVVDQRVIYVSGMLLAMKNGMTPVELVGRAPTSDTSDGKMVYSRIAQQLEDNNIPKPKAEMMKSIFQVIASDTDRDSVRINRMNNKGEKMDERSINAEIFDFIYNNVYKLISRKHHIDTLGEMYSEFLKYALGDGKENGIVLTPPYVTKMMNQLIGVDMDSRVLDLCTGSGGFLVSSMDMMLHDAEDKLKFDREALHLKERAIKSEQLFGVELDLKMYTLAATNMILRGDGSTRILKDSAFEVVKSRAEDNVREFKATHALLNPPFSYTENGMPFATAALNVMDKGGLLAIIIQDSAGSGKAISTNKQIMRKHSLIASIKMPMDLFQPSAGVQTSIYIIEAHKPHDVRSKVRFIDFRNDGYKRTGRGLNEIDDPQQKYKDILDVYVSGDSIGDIVCVDAQIGYLGNDWNYEKHAIYDTVPTEKDFEKTVSDYLLFQLGELLGGR